MSTYQSDDKYAFSRLDFNQMYLAMCGAIAAAIASCNVEVESKVAKLRSTRLHIIEGFLPKIQNE